VTPSFAGTGRDRTALLRALADVPGFYVPAFFAPEHRPDGTIAAVTPLDPERPRVAKRTLVDLDRFAPPANPSCRTSASCTTGRASR
jgi:hypothetical protein